MPFGDAFFDHFLAHVQVDVAGRAADIAEVGIGHFAGAVDDAAHDRDLDALEVAGARGDALGRALQVEQRAAARWAGDEFGLRDAHAGGLQDAEQQARAVFSRSRRGQADAVAEAVAQQRAEDGRCAQQDFELVAVDVELQMQRLIAGRAASWR